MTQFGPELLKAHKDRIAKDPEFQYIMKDIARFNALKDKRNIVSLNYAQREKENNEDDATRLARINDRFKREGKPLLKKLDDLPKDYRSRILTSTRRCISLLTWRIRKRRSPPCNLHRQNNPPTGTRNCACFFLFRILPSGKFPIV